MLPLLSGLLVAAAAYAVLRRWLAERARRRGLSDEHIREIERRGRVELDEPLDLEEAREEERRFWEEEAWEDSEEL